MIPDARAWKVFVAAGLQGRISYRDFKVGWDAREAEIPKAAEGWEEAYGKFYRENAGGPSPSRIFRAGWEAAMQKVQEEAAEREKAANRQRDTAPPKEPTIGEVFPNFPNYPDLTPAKDFKPDPGAQAAQAMKDAYVERARVALEGRALQQIREELDIDGLAEAVQRLELQVEALRVGAEGRAKILRHQAERITKLEEAAGHHDALRDRVAELESRVDALEQEAFRLWAGLPPKGLEDRVSALETVVSGALLVPSGTSEEVEE